MPVVVGVAILRAGRVLAARRAGPPAVAGRWEFPGGKVEPGESPEDAVVREVAEELGCRIVLHDWLDGQVAIADDLVLRVALAELLEAEPVAREHDRLRWLSAAELGEVDWLEADRPFLPQLTGLLRAAT